MMLFEIWDFLPLGLIGSLIGKIWRFGVLCKYDYASTMLRGKNCGMILVWHLVIWKFNNENVLMMDTNR